MDWRAVPSSTAILSDPVARGYVGAIGYHTYPYGSPYTSLPTILATSGAGKPDQDRLAVRAQLRALAQQYKLPIWLTENSHGDLSPFSFDAFRGQAIHIHDEFVYTDASAFFGMALMWDLTSQQGHFGNSDLDNPDSDGDFIHINNNSGAVYMTDMAYAVGQYARWIRPGMRRVEASSSNPLVQVSAFRNSLQNRLVLVCINNEASAAKVTIHLSGLPAYGKLTTAGEQSASGVYWKPLQTAVHMGVGPLSVQVPALSVTTLSITLK